MVLTWGSSAGVGSACGVGVGVLAGSGWGVGAVVEAGGTEVGVLIATAVGEGVLARGVGVGGWLTAGDAVGVAVGVEASGVGVASSVPGVVVIAVAAGAAGVITTTVGVAWTSMGVDSGVGVFASARVAGVGARATDSSASGPHDTASVINAIRAMLSINFTRGRLNRPDAAPHEVGGIRCQERHDGGDSLRVGEAVHHDAVIFFIAGGVPHRGNLGAFQRSIH